MVLLHAIAVAGGGHDAGGRDDGRAYALVAVGVAVRSVVEVIELTRRYMPLPRVEAKEYLPHGLPGVLEGDEAALRQAISVPLIACTPEPRLCHATELPFGRLALEVDADGPTRVVVRRFFFPAWQLDRGPTLVPSDPLRLVSFEAPAGRLAAQLTRRALPVERWSWAISGAAWAVWLILLVRARSASGRRVQRPRQGTQ